MRRLCIVLKEEVQRSTTARQSRPALEYRYGTSPRTPGLSKSACDHAQIQLGLKIRSLLSNRHFVVESDLLDRVLIAAEHGTDLAV